MKVFFGTKNKSILLVLSAVAILFATGRYNFDRGNSGKFCVVRATIEENHTEKKTEKKDSSGSRTDSVPKPPKSKNDSLLMLVDSSMRNLDTLRIKVDSLIVNQRANGDFISSYIFYAQAAIIFLLLIVIIVFFTNEKKNAQKLKEIENFIAQSGKNSSSNTRDIVATLSSSFKDFKDTVFPRSINEITGMIRRYDEKPQSFEPPQMAKSTQHGAALGGKNVEIFFADLMDQHNGWSFGRLSQQQNLYKFEFTAGQSDGTVTLNEEKLSESVLQNPSASFPTQLCDYRNGNFNNCKKVIVVKSGKVNRSGSKVTVTQRMVIDFIN